MADRQRTLKRATAVLGGPALHSGAIVSLAIKPFGAGEGIVFERADLPGRPRIPARITNVIPSVRCTSIAAGEARVSTVEHLMAACLLLGVDNALIAVEGPELPAADGSALPFVDLIEKAGIAEQDEEREEAVLASAVAWEKEGARYSAKPADEPSFAFKFKGGGSLDGTEAVFKPGVTDPRKVARARTFCFQDEIEAIRAAGLGRGGNAENVLVLRRDGSCVNDVRCEDEPAAHKLVDLVGDLALAGVRLRAEVRAEGGGHAANAEFAKLLNSKTLRNGG